MKNFIPTVSKILLIIALCGCCMSDDSGKDVRKDDAYRLDINLSGSLQNPAFSPDGQSIVFTRFRDGYNTGAADLYIYHLDTKQLVLLIADGNANVNIPGFCWNDILQSVVFTSDRDPHDEIFLISDTGSSGDEEQITDRSPLQSYEPTLSPDGLWTVFESHVIDVEDDGVITKYSLDGSSGYIDLTGNDNNKQPNWSPSGDKILYQKEDAVNGIWAIWTMNAGNGSDQTRITGINESATDAVFSGDGQWIIYSSENNDVNMACIYKIPAAGGSPERITFYSGYDGAPSVSPDGTKVAFESVYGDPDNSSGTTLWIIDISL